MTAFDRAEVAGLAWMNLEHLTELAFGGATGPWAGREWDGRTITTTQVMREELVPASYLRSLAIMLERFACGARPLAI